MNTEEMFTKEQMRRVFELELEIEESYNELVNYVEKITGTKPVIENYIHQIPLEVLSGLHKHQQEMDTLGSVVHIDYSQIGKLVVELSGKSMEWLENVPCEYYSRCRDRFELGKRDTLF